ncbi:hypothetical protein NDU88_004097 [Pleurodeles waltl]|uniref:Uncharacterized protein n=1 Tax=Pleurodeles waltl TaxID=8319 RepID=A0AAV7QBL6_PLEWA|nr:hypothetical protein NDU88_004097 [Pleurodeles waltl]
MDACNFDSLGRPELLKLFKQNSLKADKKSTKLDLQVAMRAFEEVQKLQNTSEENEVDGNEEQDGRLPEEEEREDPVQVPEFQREANPTPADDMDAPGAQDGAGSSVSVKGLSSH